MKKTLLFFFAMLSSVMAFAQTITDASQLTNTTIVTMTTARGTLTMSTTNMAMSDQFTTLTAMSDATANQFVFYTENGETALYHVLTGKYLTPASYTYSGVTFSGLSVTDDFSAATKWTLDPQDDGTFLLHDGDNTFNFGGSCQVTVDSWATADDGNKFTIVKVGELSDSTSTGVETVEIDGIKYELNKATQTAKVLATNNYAGDIVIPTVVSYEESTYDVTALDESCFRNCPELTSVEVPSGVTSFGNYCFYNCTSLVNVNIPSTVASLGSYCFYNCSGLDGIEIPMSVTSMGESCFFGCTGFASVEVPSSVTTLRAWVFGGCTGLTSVDLPSTLTSVSEYAFRGCTNLTRIVCLAEVPPTASIISFSNYSAYLYVPEASVETYEATAPWSSFANIAAYDAAGIDAVNAEGAQVVNRYALDGKSLTTPTRGINIVRLSNGKTQKVLVK